MHCTPLHQHTCAHSAEGFGFVDESYAGGTIVRYLEGQFVKWKTHYNSWFKLVTEDTCKSFQWDNFVSSTYVSDFDSDHRALNVNVTSSEIKSDSLYKEWKYWPRTFDFKNDGCAVIVNKYTSKCNEQNKLVNFLELFNC